MEVFNIVNAETVSAQTLLKCTLGIRPIEIKAYCLLLQRGPCTVQEASRLLNRSRSATQRILLSLVEKGLAVREEELIGLGGYKYVYRSAPVGRLKAEILKNLEEWYGRMLVEVGRLDESLRDVGCGLG